MDKVLRLCGVLAGAYLLYFASQSFDSNAQASMGQPVMKAVTGEILPVREAMVVNYLESYNARYPVFPDVLENTRWVHTLQDSDLCHENPRKIWTFSNVENAGRICKLISSEGEFRYKCDVKSLFGKDKTHFYTVKFGDPILPNWALEKPHVTLEREGGLRKKTIGLQMCAS